MLTAKVTKHWHQEPLKDVVGIEKTGQDLSKVTDNIAPPNALCPRNKRILLICTQYINRRGNSVKHLLEKCTMVSCTLMQFSEQYLSHAN